MKETPDYYRMAARFYQKKDLPDNYLDMDCEEFDKLLEQNVCEPHFFWRAKYIDEHIQSLSVAMENIARETRKNTLDEVREALKLDGINL